MLHKYQNASRFVLAIILFAFVLFVSGLVNKGVVKEYFPYVPCLLLLVTTWYLYKTERRSLSVIGLDFSLRNIKFLPLGILAGLLALFLASYLKVQYLGEAFNLTTTVDYSTILVAFYFILPQVVVEELLFRGYLFKKTVEVSNAVLANIIFSVLFMLVHVLDEGVMNNMGMLIMLVVSIPVGHLLFATALLKSRTLFFPIGLHLGNNWATRHLISNTDNGESIFYLTNVNTFETWTPFIVFLVIFNGFFLFVTFIIWKWDKLSILSKG